MKTKRFLQKLLVSVLPLCLGGSMLTPVMAETVYVASDDEVSSSIVGQQTLTPSIEKSPSYSSAYQYYFAAPRYIYHFVDGNDLITVLYQKDSHSLYVTKADEDLNTTNTWTVKLPDKIFGTLYMGSDGNFYAATGNENLSESTTADVIHVTRYDSNWKQTGQTAFKGSSNNVSPYNPAKGIYIPFDASRATMAELDGVLYLYMGREMFAYTDGYHHQSDITLALDMNTMAQTTTINIAGQPYNSHSFNTIIRSDGNQLYWLSHGDSYPRALALYTISGRMLKERLVFSFLSESESDNNMSNYGYNYTYTQVGGMELSENYVLTVGTSVPHKNAVQGVTGDNKSYKKNLYLTVSDKQGTLSTKFTWLTSVNPKTSDTYYDCPSLIKVNDNRFVVLADVNKSSDSNYQAALYILLDGSGNVLVQHLYEGIPFYSGVDPVYYNDQIIWVQSKNGSNTNYSENGVYYFALPYAEKESEIQDIPVTGVAFDQEEVLIKNGNSLEVTANTTPANATRLDSISYSSDNTGVAVVDEDGTITGVSKGSCTITVTTASGYTAALKVTVYEPGWLKDGSDWYWILEDGSKAKGTSANDPYWFKDPDNGNWYSLGADGRLLTSQWVPYHESNGTITWNFVANSGGVVKQRWIQRNGKWVYLGQNGTMLTNRWIKSVDGYTYYVGDDGYMVTDAWIGQWHVDKNGRWDKTR